MDPSQFWGSCRKDGLNQQAERNDQQREACARRVDVGLEPGFICHAVSVEQTVSIEFMLIFAAGCQAVWQSRILLSSDGW